MQVFKLSFQLFSFLMELAMLVAIGHWGFHQGKTNLSKYAFTFLVVLAAIVIWGIWMAPTSRYRLETNYRIVAETILFLTAAFMIYKTEHASLALVFLFCVFLREMIACLFKW